MHPTQLRDAAIARLVPLAPPRLLAGVAGRYIAGDRLEDAIDVARRLADDGILATVDVLGESVTYEAAASAFAAQYVATLDALAAAGLDPHVSVKPSALGSLVDERTCAAHVRRIAAHARSVGGTVAIDMEWATSVDATLELFRALRAEGCDNVGCVLQARLLRTPGDIAALAPLGPHVRLCKGIYPEPAAIAHTAPDAIRAAYLGCLEALLATGGRVAIATHDEELVDGALALLARCPDAPHEFQALLGVREDLVRRLARAGHDVRVYVPYGAGWYDYAVRRLRESPQIARHVAADIVGRAASRVRRPHSRGARA